MPQPAPIVAGRDADPAPHAAAQEPDKSDTPIFNTAAIALTLAAVFGYVNHRWMKLSHTIGLVVIALVVSFAVLGLDALLPEPGFQPALRQVLDRIDLHEALMKGMLSLLLFAGALHVDLDQLMRRK